MMDRYEGDELTLDLKERMGWKFIQAARDVYMQLARLHEAKRVHLDQQFPLLVSMIDEMTQLWEQDEKLRGKFIVPKTLQQDYRFAKKRYQRMNGNPEIFYKEDSDKRAALENERALLAGRIKTIETEFAREEDARRHEINDERERINTELAALKYKQEKYKERTETGLVKCMPICGKKDNEKLKTVTARIKELEDSIKKIEPLTSKSLEEKRYQMQLLHRRRWDIEKALNAHDNNATTRVRRRQNAIDNAEVVMIVRRMDIDEAMNRFYSGVATQIIHAMLNVYATLKKYEAQAGAEANHLSDEVRELTNCAQQMNCPEIANRSVETLYKKMQALSEEDKNQIVHHKPTKGKLPEALVRTLSVKNFKNGVATLGLYRKVLSVPAPASAETAPDIEADKTASSKIN